MNPVNSDSCAVKSEPGSSASEVFCYGIATNRLRVKNETLSPEGPVVKPEPGSPAESDDEQEDGEGSYTDGETSQNGVEQEHASYSKNVNQGTETLHQSRDSRLRPSSIEAPDRIRNHRFSCSECPYTCASRRNLSSHARTHTGEKPYACPECGYVCSHTQSLKRHMRNHTGEKPFSCSKCAHRFAHKQTLRTHMRVHTGEKPFSCALCAYACAQQQNLKSHMFKHTGERPFACPKCPYAGTRKENLKIHMFSHSRDKPFSCSECFYECTQKRHFIVHMRTHTA